MVKSKNIIAGLGVVAGLGMALLPLGAFAQTGDPVAESNTASHTIRGVVNDVISISVAADQDHARTYKDNNGTADVNRDFSLVSLVPDELNSSLIHTVTVDTNTRGGYDLKMYAATAADVDLRYITGYKTGEYSNIAASYHPTVKIANIENSEGDDLDPQGDNGYGWGYKVRTTTTGRTTQFGEKFLPIPADEADGTITGMNAARSADETANYQDTFEVNFGIRPTADQLAGAYEATVVYKAITKAL